MGWKEKLFVRFFASRDEAFDHMTAKNRAAEKVGDKSSVYCLVNGPENNYAVVDIDTAINLEIPYIWGI